MHEYVTSAFVLDVVSAGEYDARVFLFTKELGRVVARARSLRKGNSKLAGHLQPLMISTVRLVQKNGFQIVDALLERNLAKDTEPKNIRELIAVARLILEMTSEGQAEPELWSLLQEGDILSKRFLKVMGFDPEHAVCNQCCAKAPSSFILRDAIYVCQKCLINYSKEMYVRA